MGKMILIKKGKFIGSSWRVYYDGEIEFQNSYNLSGSTDETKWQLEDEQRQELYKMLVTDFQKYSEDYDSASDGTGWSFAFYNDDGFEYEKIENCKGKIYEKNGIMKNMNLKQTRRTHMRYDVILWDVDGTLLDFTYSQRYALCKCLEEIGVTPTEDIIARYAEINDSWWKRLEKGEVTKVQLLPGRFTDLFAEYHILCESVQNFLAHYQEYLGSVYKYIDNSLDICKALKGKCRQFVVTNGVTSTQINKMKISGFAELMEDLFISEQIGVPKPQRGFFERVFEKLSDVDKSRILIVGDSLSSDMRGGYNSGIDTCWYNPNDEINTTEVELTYSIRNLKEVLLIVEG